MINLHHLGWVECPTCEHGALKTPDDFKRGYCDACHLIRNGTKPVSEAQKQWSAHLTQHSSGRPSELEEPYRTDAEAYTYDRSIYDTD